MKHVLIIMGFFLPILSFAQITHDQFFSNWAGDIDLMLLEHNWAKANDYDSSVSLTIWKQTPVITSLEWETEIKLDFNPSSTNHLLFYLIADNPLNQKNLQAFYVKIGGASGYADAIDLYKQNGTIHTKIISGKTGYIGQDLVHAKVKVQYYENGTWKLYADSTALGDYSLQGEIIEKTILTQGYTGFNFIHTATRKDKFSFKDISITHAPLSILKVTPTGSTTITVSISNPEPIANTPNSILVNGKPVETFSQTESEIFITLNEVLLDGENQLSIINESINQVTIFLYSPNIKSGSIVFHEIMADPTPSIGLPEYEYVELFNMGDKSINLKNCSFADKTTSVAITQDVVIQPDSFLILCSKEASEYFSTYGKTVGLTTWPTLNNDSDHLQLRNKEGSLIAEIEYFQSWQSSTSKAEGGYSLEMKNPNSLCHGKSNWTTSNSPTGGTPGKANSVDNTFSTEQLLPISFKINSDSISILFDQDINWQTSSLLSFDKHPILNYQLSDNKLSFKTPYSLTHNSAYFIYFTNQTNCLNQPIPDQSFEIIFPALAYPGDLLLNEILFNPKTGGTDFVEIYNHSDKFIDLSSVKLAYRNTSSDSLIIYSLATNSQIIQPKQFLVLTKDSTKVAALHPNSVKESILQLAKFPSLNDNEGELQLIFQEAIIDQVWYSAKQHNPVISDQNGVSLERVSYTAASGNTSNWHSASSGSNYATPGFQNSQSTILKDSNKDFFIEPPVFSPDGDGYQDLAFFRYKLTQEGWLATISIFDIQGRLIKEIANNQLLGTEGFITWNGTTQHGNLANIGMYLILIDLFQPNGETKKIKETIVLGAKP